MNGPQHYAEAERVRDAIRSPHDAGQNGFDGWRRDDLIALGHLHATLALTAAFAEAVIADYTGQAGGRAWAEVAT